MRVMDLELRTWYGAPGYFILGAMHAVLFWISVSMLTPLVNRPVQRPPAAAARSHFGNHNYQQLGPYSGSAGSPDLLRPGRNCLPYLGKPIDPQPRRRDAVHLLLLRSLTIPCDPAFA